MPYKIFISSSHIDADLARDLAKRLDKTGLKVILPTIVESAEALEHKRALEHIRARIDGEALRAADEVILILTKNSLDSPWLLFEMGYATSLGKQVTPLIQGIKPKELPEIIRQMDYVKYADLDKYIAKLQQRVEEPTKSAA
jgi:nucleoside 2-deoxyribosyltransferase